MPGTKSRNGNSKETPVYARPEQAMKLQGRIHEVSHNGIELVVM